MPRIPFQCDVEYRGVAPGGEFTNDEGQRIPYSDGLKFEMELPDGDVETVMLRRSKLDGVADFDVLKLQKGDRCELNAVVSYGQGYASIVPLSLRRASKLQAAA